MTQAYTLSIKGNEARDVIHGLGDAEIDVIVSKSKDGAITISLASLGIVVDVPQMEVKSLKDLSDFFVRAYNDLKG